MFVHDHPFYLGTSGWAHRDWIGRLYPHDMSSAAYLAAYARHFNTVELEHTLYDIPTRQMVQSWYRRTPVGFRFSPCLPRTISHDGRLRNVGGVLDDFLAVILEFGDKLGPILIQLPEDFRSHEQEQLETFLSALPQEIQFAIEFRHGSWLKDTTFALLEAHRVAWVVVDAPFLPRVPRVTADFAYIRWHGHPGAAQRARHQLDPTAALRPWMPILHHLARRQRASTATYVTASPVMHPVIVRHFWHFWEKGASRDSLDNCQK